MLWAIIGHMKFWGAIAALGVFALALGGADQKPTPPAPPSGIVPADETTRILVDVTRVNMLFTVTDKKGRFITDLNREDFDVIEGKKPQAIQEFTAETDLPLRIGILIDTSSSIRDRFKFEQEDRKSTRLNSSHMSISYAVFCLK